jgi:hypothetical protein
MNVCNALDLRSFSQVKPIMVMSPPPEPNAVIKPIFPPKEEEQFMKDPVFEHLSYSQQASSQKMRINWHVIAVAAHEDKGHAEGKKDVGKYRQRVVGHLRTIIQKLERGDRR